MYSRLYILFDNIRDDVFDIIYILFDNIRDDVFEIIFDDAYYVL